MTFKMSDDNLSFASGSLLAAIPAFSWLWPLQLHLDPANLATAWMMKVIGTIVLGFLGGLSGMLGKQFFVFIKSKLKRNENKNQTK
jgi:hypothetical protein